MIRSAVTSLLFLSAAGICAAQTVSNVTKIEYTETSKFTKPGATSSTVSSVITRYLSPDGTVRTEIVNNLHHTKRVEIVNEAQDYQINIDEQTKTATKLTGIFHAAHQAPLRSSVSKTSLGKSNIFGYPCEGYSNAFGDGTIMKHWVCTEPSTGVTFVGQIETTRGGSTTDQTIVNVAKGLSVPSSLFDVPSGYTLMSMTATHGVIGLRPGRYPQQAAIGRSD